VDSLIGILNSLTKYGVLGEPERNDFERGHVAVALKLPVALTAT
jgi:hypothetical protein